MDCLKDEYWKSVMGYEGFYEISNLGNVKSLKRYNVRKDRLMKASSVTKGYLAVTLSKEGISKQFRVHRLVSEVFLKKEKGKEFVDHIDGDKTNNKVNNLEWVTSSENMYHAYSTGLNKGPLGSLQGNSILTEKDVYEIKDLLIFFMQKDIAKFYNVCPSTIHKIHSKKNWSHLK